MGALVIGLLSGVLCFYSATTMKRALGYDDSLDAFGVHGVGGIIGALLTGIFCAKSLGGQVALENLKGGTIMGQFTSQVMSIGFTIVYCGIISFVLLKGIDLVIGLRVTVEDEQRGLDITQHEEEGYMF
jgi:Amt family ammonium transporter